jgi:hypothetical protein
MSRGPGKIQRAIRELLLASPERTFTLDDLGALIYPGEEFTKSRRIHLQRSIEKIIASLAWGRRRVGNRVEYMRLETFSRRQQAFEKLMAEKRMLAGRAA